MIPIRRHFVPALAALLCVAATARAQQSQITPHIGYVYPAGGRQGTTVEIKIGGQFLDGVSGVILSGAGVQTKFIEHFKPLTQGQFNQLRNQLEELQEKRAAAEKAKRSSAATKITFTAEDEKRIAEIRKKMATYVRRPSSPAIAETVTVELTLAADAPPGERELRLVAPSGYTNPMTFCVGTLPEFSKKAATGVGAAANSPNFNIANFHTPHEEMSITLPATINGQTLPGEVDRFRFRASKYQRIVIAVGARELIPYIADAVPGWFQATLAVYDSKGVEVAYCDDYRFNPDPVLCFEVPRDGDYTFEIRDAVFRGREDFVYRISIGTIPFVTSIFPLGGPAGQKTTVDLAGWNLPGKTLTLDATELGPGVYPLFKPKDDRSYNHMLFAVDNLPEIMEKEPNDTPSTAQAVTLPVIVNGHVDKPGDWDHFKFEGKAGQEIVAEVMARRLGSPVDSVLRVFDQAGKQIAYNDDWEDKTCGLETHHADSYLRCKLPADGTYVVQIGDTQKKGGPEYAYRLRISPPRPDYALRIVPSAVTVRVGGTVPLTVYAIRRDGFTGPIALKLKEAPEGFTLGGATVPAGQDQVQVTLSAPPTPMSEPVPLVIEGTARIDNKDLAHLAVPADDMMQAFFYRHLVAAHEMTVCVQGKYKNKGSLAVLSQMPVRIPVGGTAHLQLSVPTTGLFGSRIELELNDAPDGLSIQKVNPSGGWASEVELKCEADKMKVGTQGNLIVSVYSVRESGDKTKNKGAQGRRSSVGTVPAIPFEIVEK